MFRLVADPESQRDIDNLARVFSTLGLRIAGRDRAEIEDAVRDGYSQNFARQGSGDGPWAALKPSTQKDRSRLGFAPARPILYRSGSLRDTFVEGAHASHFSQAWHSSNRFVLEEGSDDPRASTLQGGTRNMPPRSIVDLTQESERHIGDTIHDLVNRLLRREGL